LYAKANDVLAVTTEKTIEPNIINNNDIEFTTRSDTSGASGNNLQIYISKIRVENGGLLVPPLIKFMYSNESLTMAVSDVAPVILLNSKIENPKITIITGIQKCTLWLIFIIFPQDRKNF
jgi:hypothetical protein